MYFSRMMMTVALVSLFACGDDDGDGTTGKITGTVFQGTGVPLAGAEVDIGTEPVTTGADGTFAFDGVAVGSVTLTTNANWYVTKSQDVEVKAGDTSTYEIHLEMADLDVLTADASLYNTYSTSFDWTRDKVSLSLVPKATRAALEYAIYHHNPALYADPTGESQVTPVTLPDVNTGSTFDFPISGTAEQSLDQSTISNDLAGTGISSAAMADVFHWQPAIDFLLEKDFAAATPLYTAGLAVRAQKWGGSSTLPTQKIESAYLHHDGDLELWVEIVFQDFVDLAASITDTNNDGYREVFAKISSTHADNELLSWLTAYVTFEHGARDLGEILEANLDELYSQTNPSLVSATGVPYTHLDLGTVQYPFAVIEHAGVNVVNVFLVQSTQ